MIAIDNMAVIMIIIITILILLSIASFVFHVSIEHSSCPSIILYQPGTLMNNLNYTSKCTCFNFLRLSSIFHVVFSGLAQKPLWFSTIIMVNRGRHGTRTAPHARRRTAVRAMFLIKTMCHLNTLAVWPTPAACFFVVVGNVLCVWRGAVRVRPPAQLESHSNRSSNFDSIGFLFLVSPFGESNTNLCLYAY